MVHIDVIHIQNLRRLVRNGIGLSSYIYRSIGALVAI
jgi:hypothetical protein